MLRVIPKIEYLLYLLILSLRKLQIKLTKDICDVSDKIWPGVRAFNTQPGVPFIKSDTSKSKLKKKKENDESILSRIMGS